MLFFKVTYDLSTNQGCTRQVLSFLNVCTRIRTAWCWFLFQKVYRFEISCNILLPMTIVKCKHIKPVYKNQIHIEKHTQNAALLKLFLKWCLERFTHSWPTLATRTCCNCVSTRQLTQAGLCTPNMCTLDKKPCCIALVHSYSYKSKVTQLYTS